MATSPLFTAAIISFNRAQMVRDAIETALAQDFSDYELLVVDDASTDDSAQVIGEYASRATVVIRETNGGEMAARNTAMQAARGEYLCFLDSDDLWFPWTLRTFAEAIRRHRSPTVVGGKLFSFQHAAEARDVAQQPYADTSASSYFASDHYLGVMSAAIRRDAINAVGGFLAERLNCLDSDLLFRIGDRPGFVRIEAPYTLAFRQHDGIMSNTRMSYGGAKVLIESERAGKYPGGDALQRDRLRHICRRTRNIVRQCVRQGDFAKAVDLYRQTFAWNCRLNRWSFLAGMPAVAAWSKLRRTLSAGKKGGHAQS